MVIVNILTVLFQSIVIYVVIKTLVATKKSRKVWLTILIAVILQLLINANNLLMSILIDNQNGVVNIEDIFLLAISILVFIGLISTTERYLIMQKRGEFYSDKAKILSEYFNALSYYIFIVDSNGIIKEVSDNTNKLYSMRKKEIIGKNFIREFIEFHDFSFPDIKINIIKEKFLKGNINLVGIEDDFTYEIVKISNNSLAFFIKKNNIEISKENNNKNIIIIDDEDFINKSGVITLNIDDAISKLGNQTEHYLGILNKFKNNYVDFIEELNGCFLRDEINSENETKGFMLVHKLKGLCGNIGAIELEKSLVNLQELIENQKYKNIDKTIEIVKNNLYETFKDINVILKNNAKNDMINKKTKNTNYKELRDVIKVLEEPVRNHKPVQVKSILKESSFITTDNELNIKLKEMENFLHAYMFKEGLELISEIVLYLENKKQ